MKLPDPSRYNSTQSEELIADAFRTIAKYFDDSNMKIHLDNTSQETYLKVEELLSQLDRDSACRTNK